MDSEPKKPVKKPVKKRKLPRRGRDTSAVKTRAMVFDLRAQGLNFRQIGEALSITKQAAHAAFHRELEGLASETHDRAHEQRELLRARLEGVIAAHAEGSAAGNPADSAIVLKASELLAKYYVPPARPARPAVNGHGGAALEDGTGAVAGGYWGVDGRWYEGAPREEAILDPRGGEDARIFGVVYTARDGTVTHFGHEDKPMTEDDWAAYNAHAAAEQSRVYPAPHPDQAQFSNPAPKTGEDP